MTALRTAVVDVTGLPAAAASRALVAAGADIACLVGVPQGPRWRSRCAELARRAGAVVVDGGRTAGGALLVCSLAVQVSSTWTRRFRTGVGRPSGGIVVADCSIRGARLTVAAVRVVGTAEQVSDQVGAALDALPADGPVVLGLAGGQGPWSELAARLPFTAGPPALSLRASTGVTSGPPELRGDGRLVVADLQW